MTLGRKKETLISCLILFFSASFLLFFRWKWWFFSLQHSFTKEEKDMSCDVHDFSWLLWWEKTEKWASSWDQEEERGIHSPDFSLTFSLTPPGKFKSISKVCKRRKFLQERHRDGDDTKKKTIYDAQYMLMKKRRTHTTHKKHDERQKSWPREQQPVFTARLFDSSRENKKEDKSWMDEIWEEVRVWTSS